MEVENQFEVEFSDESSGDDFDPITSRQVAEFFQTVTFAETFTGGQPRPSSQLVPRGSLASPHNNDPDAGAGRLSQLSLPPASVRGQETFAVPSESKQVSK